jgi:hypothetical protein
LRHPSQRNIRDSSASSSTNEADFIGLQEEPPTITQKLLLGEGRTTSAFSQKYLSNNINGLF